MIIHLFSPFVLSTHWTCSQLLSISCSSAFACLLTVFSVRQTEEEDMLSGAGSVARAGGRKLCVVCIFQVSTQQHVERQSQNLFKVIIRQMLLETRSHAGERRMRRSSSHLCLYTSVKRQQSAYQIVLRFHLFSENFFLSSIFLLSMLVKKIKSVRRIKVCCNELSYVAGCPVGAGLWAWKINEAR